MVSHIEGDLNAKGLKIGIVVSRFNEFITGRLVEGALDCLLRHGAVEKDIEVVKVPGAFEIPMAANKWSPGKNMMRFSVWEPLSAGRRHILVMLPARPQKEWEASRWNLLFRFCLAC